MPIGNHRDRFARRDDVAVNDITRTRAARNERFFAEANALIVDEALERGRELVDVICECANPGCVDRIPMTAHDYESTHSDPAWFVVRPGHEIPEVERIVEREEAYYTVEKSGLAA